MTVSGTRQDDEQGVVDGDREAMMLPGGQDQLLKRYSSSAASSGGHFQSARVSIPPYLPSSSAVANFKVVIIMFRRQINGWH